MKHKSVRIIFENENNYTVYKASNKKKIEDQSNKVVLVKKGEKK